MENSKKDRHLVISSKLVEMGNALSKEGNETNDNSILDVGGFMVLIGGVLFSEDDVKLFGQLCSMFAAKKVLDNMDDGAGIFGSLLKSKNSNETYDEFIKRLNGLMGDNQ